VNKNDCFCWLNVGLPEDILRRKLHGDFTGAIRLIDQRLAAENLPEALRCCLTAQREMILRTPGEYPYRQEEALERVRSYIPDFEESEFLELVDAGKIGWIYRDGTPYYFDRFFETMCKAEPDFARRAGIQLPGVESAGKGSREEGRLDRCIRIMRDRGELSNRIRIQASVRLKDERFTPGMFLRVHLPIPAVCDQQSDIVIEKIFPSHGQVAPEDAPQRTICWEENMAENHEFSVVYSYTHTAIYHDISKIKGAAEQPTFHTQEQPPHIMFTPYLRSLVETLSEGTDDPLVKARRFYDFITQNMKYTFMPSYFILENIAENCARSFTGDCGVFALLFLTMCRCAGIPACWQSGFTAEPDFCGGHDWVRFYVAPYGWLYADPSYGIAGVRVGSEARRKFYFGNLDPYRMVANSAFQAPFTVEKRHWRADPYDNQVGEMETAEQALKYQDFERTKSVLMCQEL
jgi:transglutaminase-like putative cysteine protease